MIFKYCIIEIFNLEDVYKENVNIIYSGVSDGGVI